MGDVAWPHVATATLGAGVGTYWVGGGGKAIPMSMLVFAVIHIAISKLVKDNCPVDSLMASKSVLTLDGSAPTARCGWVIGGGATTGAVYTTTQKAWLYITLDTSLAIVLFTALRATNLGTKIGIGKSPLSIWGFLKFFGAVTVGDHVAAWAYHTS